MGLRGAVARKLWPERIVLEEKAYLRVRVACGLRRGGIRLRGIVTREVPSERCDKRGVAIGWAVCGGG